MMRANRKVLQTMNLMQSANRGEEMGYDREVRALWMNGMYTLPRITPSQFAHLREPDTVDIMKDLGGINMNGRGFVTPDSIEAVIIRTKDGREFEGSVGRAEYMPGPFGRQGYSELTVTTLTQTKKDSYGIKRVIFNNPATIVFWDDGSQTVVYCQDNVKMVKKVVDGKEVEIAKPQKAETYSEEVGLAMAIAKKHYGNAGAYNNVFKKFVPGMKEREKAEKKAKRTAKKERETNG